MAAIHYAEVPEHWKHPFGPYRRAPAEFGGDWWLVNPFTTGDPWVTQLNKGGGSVETFPEGFEEIFGGRPKLADFLTSNNPSEAYRVARDRFAQDLKYFKRAGAPAWLETSQLVNADETYRAWGLGLPRYYEGRYGFMGRFVNSQIRDFEAPAWTLIFGAHQLIAGYQMALLDRGVVPEKRHPFVPPHLWPDAAADVVKRAMAGIESEINAQLAPKQITGTKAASKKSSKKAARVAK